METTAGFPRAALAAFALLLAACVPLSGCMSSLTARKSPKADLTQLKHIFVERRLNENHRMDEMVVKELKALGYDADSGPLTMVGPETDAVITYEDQWVYDFTTHLIGFSLVVVDNRHHQQIAEGRYDRPSATHMSPEEMIHLTVLKVFRG